MKVINKCLIFNSDELHIVLDAIVYTEMDFIKMLGQPSITDKIENDEEARKKGISMCKHIQELNHLIDLVLAEGDWPKSCKFSPPFDREFSEHIHKLTPEELLNNFISANKRIAAKEV